jgi:2'-5' RNA ligase
VYQLRQRAEIPFLGSLLPAHVSLKQPFTFENMDVLEDWFDSFSKTIVPFRIDLERVYYDGWDDYAIVGFDVLETPALRNLHNQINVELQRLVLDSSAPHDGEEYRFHLTVELGKAGSTNPFLEVYESLLTKELNLSFQAEFLALFFYADGAIGPGSFICYKVLPLSGSAQA